MQCLENHGQESYTILANIGEQLGNSDAKMFEVLIKVDGVNPELRPAMTTYNKIVINAYEDVVYIPTECVAYRYGW